MKKESKMKKLFFAVLVLCLTLACLAGCGDSKQTTPPTTTPPPTTPPETTPPVTEYTVTFSVNGVDTTVSVKEGELPVFGGSTADRTDGTKTYRFAGWDKEIAPATENVTYTAIYKRVLTLRWVDAFGEFTTTILAGETPVPHADATGDRMNESTVYLFTGWDKALSPITEAAYDAAGGDYAFTALYSTSARTYNVTFKNGSETVATERVAYGEKPIYSGEPLTKEGYNYYFWTNLDKEVTSDTVCEATFTVYDAEQLLWALSRDNMSYARLDWEIAEERAINDNRGAVIDEAGGLLLLILEYRNAPESSTFKATAKAKIVESMKYLMSSEAEAPMFSLEPYWSYNPLTALTLLAKNTPDIWGELTALEQEKYDFMMKCFTYIVNLGFADGNGYFTGPGYRGNFHKSWNSNYRLALLPVMLYAGRYFGGADAVDAILADFSYDATMAKFAEYGWTRAITEWSVTPPTFTKDVNGNTVPAYQMPTQKHMMENATASGDIYYDRYGDGIPDNGGFGKGVRQPFKYNGVRLDNVAGVFNQLLEYNYSGGKVVSEMMCRPNADTPTFTKAYILDGTKSPYEGFDGMMVELGKENRASCLYASEDFILVCVSLATFKEFGMYDIEQDALKDNLFYKTWIGNMDFLYKIAHGWQSFQTSSDPMSKPTYETDDKGQLLWRSWWEDSFGHYTVTTLPYKDPFSLDVYENNFNTEDFNAYEESVSIGDNDLVLNTASGGTGVYFKTVTDPNSASNKYIAIGVGKNGGTGGFNANLKVTGGLTKMGEHTKLQISFKLAKDPEAEKLVSAYMRFRATGSSDTINFFETVAEGSGVKFLGQTVAGHVVTDTMQSYTMVFDFATGAATLSVNGTQIATGTMKLPAASSAATLVDWIATTKKNEFVFNWGSRAGATEQRGLIFDDLSVTTIPNAN